MQQQSLFVIVPGFGAPHTDEKVRILENNLRIIKHVQWTSLKIRVCCYDPSIFSVIPAHLRDHPDIEWIYKKGIVGQFIHSLATPSDVATFEYVMILLDDVELKDSVNFCKMIEYQDRFGFDIISPSMTLNSKYQYNYMLHEPQNMFHIKVTSACEAFCYFMSRVSYEKYYLLIEPNDNPWLWGVDLTLYKYHKMKIGILNKMQMHHHYKNECYAMRTDVLPTDGYNSVLRKYNASAEAFVNMKAVHYFIFDTSGL